MIYIPEVHKTLHSQRERGRLGEALLARWPDPTVEGWADVAAVAAFAADVARRTLLVTELVRDRPERALRWADKEIAGAVAGGEPGWGNEVQTLRAVVLAALGRTDEAIEQVRAEAASRSGSPDRSGWSNVTELP